MNALTRRVSGLEEDLEKTEEKMVAAVAKLDKAGTAADDSERAKKVFQSKADEDEKRIIALEKDLKEAREKALTRLELPLTTLNVPRRFSRARLTKTRRGSLLWRRTRPPTQPTTRSPRSWLLASPTSRRPRSVLTS